ncbi:tetratricopeptide repeat domain-containing protein [Coemansia furcata]|nr:tetratricopeptide repeat domain-containing protein [Coemansia furcata]
MSNSIALLAEIRQSSERRSFEVLKLAEPLLLKGSVSQAGDDGTHLSVLFILDTRFKDSQRVKRLSGLVKEALGQSEEAQTLYSEMLEKDATNVLASKRLIALLKTQGQTALAIRELVTYLDTHGNDFEAWLELSHLYLAQHLYPQAAFCLEEVILQQPANHYFHLHYAELQYTMGNLDIALKEYLRVVELSTDNVRGFYGVKLTADRLMTEVKKGKSSGNKKDQSSSTRMDNVPQLATLERLLELATERLVSAYNRAGDISKKTAEQWLKE